MTNAHTESCAILGAGCWGTALALYLARQNKFVYLWSNSTSEITDIVETRINQQYFPEHSLPEIIYASLELDNTLRDCTYVILAIPSFAIHSVLELVQPHLQKHQGIIIASKGLDPVTQRGLHATAKRILGNTHPVAILAGPSFAKEVAAGVPTAAILASEETSFAKQFIAYFSSEYFHLEHSSDIVGTELAGVVKNIIAILAGMSDGLGLGTNSRCAVITRGFQEMIKIGSALGGKMETFTGLAGIGDLVLTASDNASRNRRFGLALGQGKTPEQAEKEIAQAIEGKQNIQQLLDLAQQHQLDAPVCAITNTIMQGKCPALRGILDIMALSSGAK